MLIPATTSSLRRPVKGTSRILARRSSRFAVRSDVEHSWRRPNAESALHEFEHRVRPRQVIRVDTGDDLVVQRTQRRHDGAGVDAPRGRQLDEATTRVLGGRDHVGIATFNQSADYLSSALARETQRCTQAPERHLPSSKPAQHQRVTPSVVVEPECIESQGHRSNPPCSGQGEEVTEEQLSYRIRYHATTLAFRQLSCI